MNIRFDRRKSLGPLTLIAGAYLAWKYRFQIQEKLESVGVKTPWLNNGLEDTVRSGGAKLKGAINRQRLKSSVNSVDNSASNF